MVKYETEEYYDALIVKEHWLNLIFLRFQMNRRTGKSEEYVPKKEEKYY